MKNTNIQWCHSTINPVMGCDGCELWKPASAVGAQLASLISCGYHNGAMVRSTVMQIIGDRHTSELYRDREVVVSELALTLGFSVMREELVDIIREECKCYAGLLGTMRAGHKGYADTFETPKLFPGRMAIAANWGLPTPAETEDKPWLEGMPRLIFISDKEGVPLLLGETFEHSEHELHCEIVVVTTPI